MSAFDPKRTLASLEDHKKTPSTRGRKDLGGLSKLFNDSHYRHLSKDHKTLFPKHAQFLLLPSLSIEKLVGNYANLPYQNIFLTRL